MLTIRPCLKIRCGIILNALHLLVRFSVLVYASRQAKSYRAGRSWFDIAIGRNQNVLTAADERLEEIRRLKMGLRGVDGGDGWWGWNLVGWTCDLTRAFRSSFDDYLLPQGNVITFTLILISFANAAYVLTRRKEYQMHLRKVGHLRFLFIHTRAVQTGHLADTPARNPPCRA